MLKIIPDNNYKANIESLLCNMTYLFKYNMKTIQFIEFSNLEVFYVNNFQVRTNVNMELQLQA